MGAVPEGSGQERVDRLDMSSSPGPGRDEDDRPVVLLVSATWAGPSRPAPTVLRELARRWGDALRTVLVEDPGDEVLDLLDIDVVPTWLRLVPAVAQGGHDSVVHRADDQHISSGGDAQRQFRLAGTDGEDGGLSGVDGAGRATVLRGSWLETCRLTGAQPKHVVDTELRAR